MRECCCTNKERKLKERKRHRDMRRAILSAITSLLVFVTSLSSSLILSLYPLSFLTCSALPLFPPSSPSNPTETSLFPILPDTLLPLREAVKVSWRAQRPKEYIFLPKKYRINFYGPTFSQTFSFQAFKVHIFFSLHLFIFNRHESNFYLFVLSNLKCWHILRLFLCMKKVLHA